MVWLNKPYVWSDHSYAIDYIEDMNWSEAEPGPLQSADVIAAKATGALSSEIWS